MWNSVHSLANFPVTFTPRFSESRRLYFGSQGKIYSIRFKYTKIRVEWNATTIRVEFCYKRITICLHVLLLGFLSDARNSTLPLCFPFSLSVHFIAISNRELSPAHEASVGSLHIQFIETAFGLFYETVTNFRSFIFIIAVGHDYSHCNGFRNGGLWMKVLWKIGVENHRYCSKKTMTLWVVFVSVLSFRTWRVELWSVWWNVCVAVGWLMLRDDRSCNWCVEVQLYLNRTQNRNFFVTPMDTLVTVLSSLRVTRSSIVWLYVIYNLHRKNRKTVQLLRLFQGDIPYNLARYGVFTNLSGVRSKRDRKPDIYGQFLLNRLLFISKDWCWRRKCIYAHRCR
jgi:hypothetical protein